MSDSAQSLWPQAGYAQLKKDARGHLTVTDDFLRVLLLRPELAPIESSCKHEIQIHERLLEIRAWICKQPTWPRFKTVMPPTTWRFGCAFAIASWRTPP
ncbi:MAG: DUF6352 family protein [Limnohabitans sp.]